MNNKDFSAAAHLIHSRLQLIRTRLKTNGSREPKNFIETNYDYFTKAVQSVSIHHRIICIDNDIMQAARLFLLASIPETEYVYYVVNHGNGPHSKPVTSLDNGRTLIPADPDDRLSEEEAKELLEAMRVWHGISHLSIGTKNAFELNNRM